MGDEAAGAADAAAAGGGAGEGDNIFGKFYTYEELLTVERPEVQRPKRPKNDPIERPAHWPEDTVPDTGPAVYWLPEDWTQAIKTTITGKTLKAYVAPAGPEFKFKRFFHKKDIEAYLGRKLDIVPPKKGPPEEPTHRKAPQPLSEAVPIWPDEFLPHDWRVAYRKLPSGLHRIYIPPGQDKGFLWHRACVQEYLQGNPKPLTSFGTSRPAVQRSVEATSVGAKRNRDPLPDGYVDDASLRVVRLPVLRPPAEVAGVLAAAGSAEAEQTAAHARQIYDLLLARHFDAATELASVVWRPTPSAPAAPAAPGAAPPAVVGYLCGVYFRMPVQVGGRPCFQKAVQVRDGRALACPGLYISWSVGQGRWKIGALSVEKVGLAFCAQDQPGPEELEGPWKVFRSRADRHE